MFRTLLILGGVAIAAFMAGWFTIDRSENETTIRFNRDEIRADARGAIAKGKELLDHEGRPADDPDFVGPYDFEPGGFGDNQSYPPPAYQPNTGNYPTYSGQGTAGQATAGQATATPPPGYPNQQATRPAAPWDRPSTANQDRRY